IGALGSTRTHHARVERFLSLGFSRAQIDRIHGPVGLPIGAATPAEIAASILAQIISALRLF
ncbi:MAG TPA: XdhC/CoxI family protein, partial [Rhodobacteraceae bacterium]|nr:XdhC/CoxI family protein [Paracoccaceae bacterium]